MSSHVSDDPSEPGGRPPSDWQPTPAAQPSAPPPVDPSTLPDYAEYQAWKQAQAERQRAAGEPPAVDFERLVLRIPDGETVHEFRTVDVTDENVIAHLQLLVTFADNDMDRAGALFEALLGPAEYDRLRKAIRPMIRRIGLAYFEDPENNPSIQDVWVNMARTISEPIKHLQSDPKDYDSPDGRSHTGRSSITGSEPKSALPPSS